MTRLTGLLLGIALLLLVLGLRLQAHPPLPLETTARAEHGAHPAEDAILARAESLLPLLLPDAGPLRLSIERSDAVHPDGSLKHRWEVEAEDTTGWTTLKLIYDAGSGNLLYVMNRPSVANAATGARPLYAPEAVRRSARWLGVLGLAAPGSDWRPNGSPQRTLEGWWSVYWQAGDRRAQVVIEDHTGDLRDIRTSAMLDWSRTYLTSQSPRGDTPPRRYTQP